jgi:DNA ligase (NAD+)
VAQVVAAHFHTLEAVKNASQEELNRVPDIGYQVGEGIREFFGQEKNTRVLDRLLAAGVAVAEMAEDEAAMPLAGKTFVFTGRLSRYTRAEAEERLDALGGRATSSVSGQTDFVVPGGGPGSKLDEARRHNVRVLDEEAFERLLQEPGAYQRAS